MRPLVALAVLAAVLCGARSEATDLALAVKAGLNRSPVRVTGPGAFDADAATRGTFGVALSVGVANRLRLEPELLCSERAFTSPDFGVEARIDSRGLQVPVSLKTLFGSRRLRPFVLGGAGLTFIGRTRQHLAGIEEDIGDDVRDVDVGLHLGAGLEVTLRRGALGFEVRYVWGLRDLDPDVDVVKSRSLLVLAGYRF